MLIRRFGPLVKTLIYESKHQYFKALTHLTKNRENICQSLAKRHQFVICLQYTKYDFDLTSKLIQFLVSKNANDSNWNQL